MTKVICENCNLEIDVPEGYNAPYIQCPDCASIQRFVRTVKGEPKFKILDQKGRERANSKVVGATPRAMPGATQETTSGATQEATPEATSEVTSEETPTSQAGTTPKGKNNTQPHPFDFATTYKPLDKKQMILDSIGEEGLLIAYKLVGNYLWSTSDKFRNNGRAKAIRRMMKEKYPLEIASKAIEFAEKSPEGLKYARQKLITMLVIIALIGVGMISILLAFL